MRTGANVAHTQALSLSRFLQPTFTVLAIAYHCITGVTTGMRSRLSHADPAGTPTNNGCLNSE